MAETNAPQTPHTQTPHKRAPAVTRAVQILRRLGEQTEPVGVNQLARDLSLVPSTCLHILRVLVDEGLVDFDRASKRYAIGVGILPIARNAIQRNTFATLAQPKLAELSKAFGVTAMATQLIQDRQMVVVALSPAQLPFRLSTELGSQFPALASATGRCVAAYGAADEASLRRRFDRVKWDKTPDFETWKAQIAQTRRDGYGIDVGEFISGVTIIAAPLFDATGSVAQTLVAIGITEKMQSSNVADIAQEMQRVCADISSLLMSS